MKCRWPPNQQITEQDQMSREWVPYREWNLITIQWDASHRSHTQNTRQRKAPRTARPRVASIHKERQYLLTQRADQILSRITRESSNSHHTHRMETLRPHRWVQTNHTRRDLTQRWMQTVKRVDSSLTKPRSEVLIVWIVVIEQSSKTGNTSCD